MSEMPGIVTSVDGQLAVVEIAPRTSGCGRCHEPGGCGAAATPVAGKGARSYRLPNSIGVRVGDEVLLTIPEGSLLKVSMLVYLLPVALVITGAAGGSLVSAPPDLAALTGAAVGLVLGFAILRLAQSRLLTSREPLLAMRFKDCAFHSHEEINSC
jgi:sigma-E factor negative regulatory protein RseC